MKELSESRGSLGHWNVDERGGRSQRASRNTRYGRECGQKVCDRLALLELDEALLDGLSCDSLLGEQLSLDGSTLSVDLILDAEALLLGCPKGACCGLADPTHVLGTKT